MLESLIFGRRKPRDTTTLGPVGILAVNDMIAVTSDSSAAYASITQNIAIDEPIYSAGYSTVSQYIAVLDDQFADVERVV